MKIIKIYSLCHGATVLTSNNSEPNMNWKECLAIPKNRVFTSVD